MLLSNAHFFAIAGNAVQRGVLYPEAPSRMKSLRRLFPDDELEFFMAIRNPATFLPLVLEKSSHTSITDILGRATPQSVRWSDMISAVREAAPDVPITVWCNEDTPLTWAQIMREMAGLDPEEQIAGGFDLLTTIMSKEGMARFREYLKKHGTMTEMQTRRVIAAFLDKFALEDEIEEAVVVVIRPGRLGGIFRIAG